jgi:lipopolysaccharide/colanic/teichoic acid biosynthesis glycosyltransferase
LFKRLFDLTLATLTLLALALPLLVLCCLIRLKLGSPILFCQVRPGLNGVPFTLFKFRTMNETLDEYGNLLSDEDRLTPFGQILRRTSLDELPELWNVLKGDMSLVGPRPLLMEYLPLYTQEQYRRHEMRPGITGWAQVNGRNLLSWDERFKLDVWYVDHHSILLDLKILMITIKKVIKREGVAAKGEVTMPKFKGQ